MELAVLISVLSEISTLALFSKYEINENGVVTNPFELEITKGNVIELAERSNGQYCYSLFLHGHNWGSCGPISEYSEPVGDFHTTLMVAYRDMLATFQRHIDGGATSCYNPKNDEKTKRVITENFHKYLKSQNLI